MPAGPVPKVIPLSSSRGWPKGWTGHKKANPDNLGAKVSTLTFASNHLKSYPCPKNINFLWNQGFLVALTMLLQILTGILLGLHYTPDINSAYYSLMHIFREVYFGWSFRYLHSSGASFLFLLIFLHLGRALIYGSNFYMPNTWFSGIFLLFTLGATAFMGYVLPWGQMSFWGATVITNLFSGVPCLVFWVCGGFFVSNPSLSRFFVFHFLLPFLICGFIFLHLFYLHTISSTTGGSHSSGHRIIPPENQNFYNLCFTLHGLFMIFFLVMPGLYGGFGNYFVPIFLGAPEVGFPRVNSFSFLSLPVSYGFILVSTASEFPGGAGWTLYPPLP